jgi:peroxiredoxin
MARIDDIDRQRWVDNRLARLAPDPEWRPNPPLGLERLRRANLSPQRWRLGIAAAVTATVLLVIPNATVRGFAHTCGVFIARFAGLTESRPSIGDLTLNGGDGQPVKLSALRGSVVLLTIWPPTCERCETEEPWFDEFQREYGERGLTRVGTSLERHGSAAGVSVPATLILDREGRIAVRHVGFCSKAEYRHDIEKLLAE